MNEPDARDNSHGKDETAPKNNLDETFSHHGLDSRINSTPVLDPFQPDADFFSVEAQSETRDSDTAQDMNLSKLDVLRAKQINLLGWVNIATISCCCLYMFVMIILFRTVLYTTETLPIGKEGARLVHSYTPSLVHEILSLVTKYLELIIFGGFSSAYIYRVHFNNRFPVSLDQRIVSALLILHLIGTNPFNIWDLTKEVLDFGNNEYAEIRAPWYRALSIISLSATSIGWVMFSIVYIWFRIHLFGLFKTPKGWSLFCKIFLPKTIPTILSYTITYNAFFNAQLILNPLPFASLAFYIADSRARGFMGKEHLLYVSLISAYDLIVLLCMVVQGLQTSRALRNADYFTHRSRIVGYRVFVFYSRLYYSALIVLEIVFALTTPPGVRLNKSFLNGTRLYSAINVDAPIMHRIVKIIWIISIAYMSLPSDSVGWSGWFRPCTKSDDDLGNSKPVVLSRKNDTETNPSVFAFRNHCMMLNFSWIAYARTEEKSRLHFDDLQQRSMSIFECKRTDTRYILADFPDRIVIAFRGTSTQENIMTDLKVSLVPLSDYLPTIESSLQLTQLLEGPDLARYFSQAKIHHGFALAYKAAADSLLRKVKIMLENDMRPVYLTGHSLGGALATVCSFDLVLSGIISSSDQVSVTTFGSPKCGNMSWVKLYNRVVPCHWRVQIDTDAVTMIPKVGYRHVGKTALVTSQGQLLLDPSALDTCFKTVKPSISSHKKPAYKMGLTMVCMKQGLNGLEEDIWSFPVKETEIRKWEHSCRLTFSENQVTTLIGSKVKVAEEKDDNDQE